MRSRLAIVALLMLGGLAVAPRSEAAVWPEGPNLIVNPGAELGQSGNGTTVTAAPTGWTRGGSVTTVSYEDAAQGLLDYRHPGPATRGSDYWAGGPDVSRISYLEQIIDLSGYSGPIDRGESTFRLRGWFGGKGTDRDRARMVVVFRNTQGATLGSGAIGPVTAEDRGNAAKMLARSSSGAVPVGARTARVRVEFIPQDGPYNNAYADALGMFLTPPPDPGVTVADTSAQEGDDSTGSLLFPVTLTAQHPSPVTIGWQAIAGTAGSGDIALGSGSLVIPPGETSGTIQLGILGDDTPEPDETMRVVLTSTSAGYLREPQATGTILNDDVTPLPTIQIDRQHHANLFTQGEYCEGQVGPLPCYFRVRLIRTGLPSGGTASVGIQVIDQTATSGADFTEVPTRVSLDSTTGVVRIRTVDDGLCEDTETFLIRLVDPINAVLGPDIEQQLTIVNTPC